MSQPAGGRNFQIDKLLETVVKEKVSDLHITVGQPPVVRSGGRSSCAHIGAVVKNTTAQISRNRISGLNF